jgi:hypothetical protein
MARSIAAISFRQREYQPFDMVASLDEGSTEAHQLDH